jgi:hypothetical protein
VTLRKPFHVLSDGRVKATIWHETHDGRTRFNVAFTRLFNDHERWWDAACFQRDDMPALGRLAEDVQLWIAEHLRKLGHVEVAADGEGTS